jgi:hypothetical protein
MAFVNFEFFENLEKIIRKVAANRTLSVDQTMGSRI